MNLLMIILSFVIVPIVFIIDSTFGIIANAGWLINELIIQIPLRNINQKILEKSKKISDKQIKWNMRLIAISGNYNMKKSNIIFDKLYDTEKITGDRVYKILGKRRWFIQNFPSKESLWMSPNTLITGIPGPWPYKGYKHKPGTRFYPYYKKDDKGNMIPVHK